MTTEAEHDAEELTLFADTTRELHESSWLPIAKRLVAMKLGGHYSREDAAGLFLQHADRAAKRYQREIEPHRFSTQSKFRAAEDWAKNFEVQFKAGDLKHLYPESYRKSLNGLNDGPKTKLDLLLDRVTPRHEVTLDAEDLTPEQVKRVIKTAKARGLHVSGTHRWLLIRDLRGSGLDGMEVADEIWRQLGRARVMIGAKDPMGDKDSLTFSVGANPKGVKWIKVRLDPSDTYTVRFLNRKGLPLHEVDDIYSENLVRVIEMHTGLRTSL